MSSFDFNSGQSSPQPSMQPTGVYVKPSTWPQVVGIIGIVLGGLGICTHACGVLGSLLGGAFMSFMSGKVNDPMFSKLSDVMSAYMLPTAAVGVLALGMSVWLLIASIALVRRRPGAAQLRVWGMVQCVAIVIRSVVGVWVALATARAMQQLITESGKAPPGGMPLTMDPAFQVIQQVVVGLFLLVFPVFVIIWFSRAKIRDEINSWRVPASGAMN